MIVFLYYYVNTIYNEIHKIFENSVHLSGFQWLFALLKEAV